MEDKLDDRIHIFYAGNFFHVWDFIGDDDNTAAIRSYGYGDFFDEYSALHNDNYKRPKVMELIEKHDLAGIDVEFRVGLVWKLSRECVIREFEPKLPFIWLSFNDGPFIFISRHKDDLFFLKFMDSEL